MVTIVSDQSHAMLHGWDSNSNLSRTSAAIYQLDVSVVLVCQPVCQSVTAGNNQPADKSRFTTNLLKRAGL